MNIPTKFFMIEGRKGKFKVASKPSEMVGGSLKYYAEWKQSSYKYEDTYGETREAALQKLLAIMDAPGWIDKYKRYEMAEKAKSQKV